MDDDDDDDDDGDDRTQSPLCHQHQQNEMDTIMHIQESNSCLRMLVQQLVGPGKSN
jgi:hypothetical protein